MTSHQTEKTEENESDNLDLDILEQERIDERQYNQRKMAWTGMVVMVLVTAFLFSPLISEERISALTDVITIFYLTQASIIGAYMGFESLVNRSIKQSRSRNKSPTIGRR